MITVRCPECDSRLEVDDEHLGQDVRCPACRAVFTARPAGEVPAARPSHRPPRDDDDGYDRPRRRRTREDVIDDARRAVFLPALFSAITCILAVLFHIADTAVFVANPNAMKNNPMMKMFGGGQPPPQEAILAGKAFVILYGLVALAGSFAMMRLKGRPFAVTAMVMQIVPCLGACCILTLPLGIWGLIVLNNPDVKDGFDLARDEGGRRPAARDRDRDRSYDDEEDDRWRER